MSKPRDRFPLTGGEADESAVDTPIHIFVDEAGDPTIFNATGESIVGTNGCSSFFIMGKLEVEEPQQLATKLDALRTSILGDPYFAGVESCRPERRKTALTFHAKDDMPEIRMMVFELLCAEGRALRFHAVICDKQKLCVREQARRQADPTYRFRPDNLYDGLVQQLFGKLHGLGSRYNLCIAKRGSKDRTHALVEAIRGAEQDFERNFGFSRGGLDAWDIQVAMASATPCLQAVDYFLWALQRAYEPRFHPTTGELIREDRFLRKLWPQVVEIHDLDHGRKGGTFYGPVKMFDLEERFSVRKRRKKAGS